MVLTCEEVTLTKLMSLEQSLWFEDNDFNCSEKKKKKQDKHKSIT